MSKANLLDTPFLRSERYKLTILDPSDARELLQLYSYSSVVEFMDIEPLANIEDASGIISWARSIRESGKGVRFTIRDEENVLVGTIGYNSLIFERAFRGEIAFDVASTRWRQGVMSEVLPVIIEWGFQELGLHRIEAFVTPGNVPSCALLEKHSFTLEGVLRDYAFWKGRFWDQCVYSRLQV